MQKKYDGIPSTFVFDKKGPLRFGGKAVHKGVTPAGCKVPMHHILTLDTSDPLCPVENAKSKELPLYYPLRYGLGGGEVQYEVNDDSSIRIIYLHYLGEVIEADDPFDFPFPDYLPGRKGRLRALSYEEARAVAFADLNTHYPYIHSDSCYLKSAGWKDGIRLGGHFLAGQKSELWQCKNKKCVLSKQMTTLEPIALIPDSPVEGIEIFGDSSVQLFWGLCRGCGTVVATNVCND